MDKLSNYRNIIKNILIEYDRICNSSPDEDLESLLALDDERDRYLWFQIG
jgi:hypothetical protein